MQATVPASSTMPPASARPAPMPVSVLYSHHRQLSPRVRVFVDWVADVMGREA